MRGWRWKWIAIIVGGIAAAALVVLIVIVAPFAYALFRNPFDDKPFQRGIWLRAASDSSPRNPRGLMAEDLRNRFLRKGMPKKSVHSLLGEPDNSQYDEQVLHVDCYYLGSWGFMDMEGDYLVVHYDKAEKIASTEVYSH